MKAVSGFGFRRAFTPAELAEIDRLRTEMRERLFCSDVELPAVLARQARNQDTPTNTQGERT